METAAKEDVSIEDNALVASLYDSDKEVVVENTAEAEADSDGTTADVEAIESDDSDTESDEVEANADTEVADDGDSDADEESLFYDIDGEEINLKQVREWKAGHMKDRDYRQKTQVLAEKGKSLDSTIESYQAKIDALDDSISSIQEMISSGDEVDFDYLRETDTSEYLRQKELKTEREAKLGAAKQKAEEIKAQELNNLVAHEQKLLIESNPEWKDEKLRNADIKLVNDYIQEQGFTSQEAAQLVNHKMINALKDAAKYAKLKNKAPSVEKRVKQAPKAIKPSVRKGKPTQKKSVADSLYGK